AIYFFVSQSFRDFSAIKEKEDLLALKGLDRKASLMGDYMFFQETAWTFLLIIDVRPFCEYCLEGLAGTFVITFFFYSVSITLHHIILCRLLLLLKYPAMKEKKRDLSANIGATIALGYDLYLFYDIDNGHIDFTYHIDIYCSVSMFHTIFLIS
ncbi:hypothetical protein ACJX0J_018407, partial [Zea mays]